MIKNYSYFFEGRRKNINICVDCSKHAEAFFVKNEIWDIVPKSKAKREMCLKCLEKRLGRKLTKSDFQTGGTGDIHPHQEWWDSIEESTTYLNAISTETLETKLEDLQLQMAEIQEEMSSIRSILEFRKTNDVTEFAKTLPESIFNFNKEQLDFIFEHHNGVNSTQYNLARTFYRELIGIHDLGYNPKTNQTKFAINISDSFNSDDEYLANDYRENEEQIKSIKFLGENLERVDGSVEFLINYYFDQSVNYIRYVSETELYVTSYYGRKTKYNNISKMLEYLVDEDLESGSRD